jgi:Holliday junction resolvase
MEISQLENKTREELLELARENGSQVVRVCAAGAGNAAFAGERRAAG